MRCQQCEREFEVTAPVRCEQRFCSAECRKRWHYNANKRAQYAAEVSTAEARKRGQLQQLDLKGLGIVETAAPPIKRRRIA